MTDEELGGGPLGIALRRPITVTVGVLVVWLFGALSIGRLPIQLTPDVSVPTLTVTTRWPGASPLEVEREVVEAQEEVLKNVSGLDRMTSESKQDESTVTLEFSVGTDIDEALVRVNNALSQVPDLPDNVLEPVINTADSAGPPLAVLVMRKVDQTSMAPYRTWGQNTVVPRFERIPGVAGVRYFGGRDSEVHVLFDPGALAARGIAIDAVVDAVRSELRDVSAGAMEMGKRRFVVRTKLTPPDPSDFDRIVLAVGDDGEPVRLGDVGSVSVTLGKQRSFVLSDGQETIAMLLDRESGSNVLEVTRAIRAEVASSNDELLAPLGIELYVASDQVGYINDALDLVRNNLVLGALLAVLVLWIFLRSLRAALLVAVAIPTCVMGTVVGMTLMGRSVNVVSLAGMAFAVGMVVDNAIVVIESIVAERQRGLGAMHAAFVGAGKVWGAIVASTATTLAVFVPILGWQGEVGQLLQDVAVAIVLAVSLSLFVSVLVIPSFAARLPTDERVDLTPEGAVKLGARARVTVVRWVRGLVARPLASAGVVAGAVGAAVLTAGLLLPAMEYLPEGNRPLIFGVIVPPPGYSVEEMRVVGDHIQERLLPHIGQEQGGIPKIDRTFFVGSPGNGFMGATAARSDEVPELIGFIRSVQAEVPAVFGFAFQASLFGRSIGSSRGVDVEVSGADLDEIRGTAGRLFGMLQQAIPGAQVRPLPSLDAGGPELRLLPKREVATAMGLDGATLGRALDAMVDGRRIGEYGDEGEPKIDVLVKATPTRRSPGEIAATPLATPTGEVTTLGATADLVETIAPISIRHVERRRSIALQVTPPSDVALETALAIIEDQVLADLAAQGGLPPGIQVTLAGTADDLGLAQRQMAGVLLLAVLISYLLMSALFEDFLAPVAILVSVPLAAAGGILGLRTIDTFLAAQPFDMMTALGFVILIGVVVNNPILVVDGALARQREGAGLVDAIAGGVEDRVRPIFMTTLTTLAGLLPLVVIPGQGSELYRGVGAVVLGGLVLSTLLTIVVIPAIYSLLQRARGVA